MLDLRLGVLMAVLLGVAVIVGAWTAALSTEVWLAAGLGGFVVGWIFQFVGHAREGRNPAFVDDLVGLIIGPLFVLAEALFLLGMLPSRQAVARAGGLSGASMCCTVSPWLKSRRRMT